MFLMWDRSSWQYPLALIFVSTCVISLAKPAGNTGGDGDDWITGFALADCWLPVIFLAADLLAALVFKNIEGND